MALYNTIPAPTKEEDTLLETTSSKPKSIKRLVAGAVAVSFVLGALAATAISAKAVQTNNFPMMAQSPSPATKKLVNKIPYIEPSSPGGGNWKYWAKWSNVLNGKWMKDQIDTGFSWGVNAEAMAVTFTDTTWIYHAYGPGASGVKVFEGDDVGADYWAFGDDVKGKSLADYKVMMGVCEDFLDGSMVARCKVQEGFQAVVGVGVDLDQDGPEGYPHCKITVPKDKMQVLAVVYDDLPPEIPRDKDSAYPSDDFYSQNVYAPHVVRCEYCPTNPDDLVASFKDLSKCHVDNQRIKGVLYHNDPEKDMPEDNL